MDRLSALFFKYYGDSHSYIHPLTGSASNRRYFRMGNDNASCIGVLGVDSLENRAFTSIARHFSLKGIPVPEIYAESEDGMAYIQEDLGDCVLYDCLADADAEAILCKTMGILPEIQFKASQDLDFSVCHPLQEFDRRLVMFDLNYFKYCFLKPSGTDFNEVLLQDEFERFADALTKVEMEAFMYRDFNARNVLLKDREPYFIDFQGGMRGPLYYDVASFIWQARAGYSDELKSKMLNSYLETLAVYKKVDREEFMKNLRNFIFFRTLQVLGAYGFRGLVEQKARFVISIPAALKSLSDQLDYHRESYPYMVSIFEKLVADKTLTMQKSIEDHQLEVKIYSFSYKKGIPYDRSGNGGGYVFDCRSIHNPGRYEPYKKITGRDEPVIRFLEEDGEIISFMNNVYGLIDPHVKTYLSRGFTDLSVCFGCTGGQHRSVYCADHLAQHISETFPEVKVHLIHREQNIEEML